MYRISNVLVGDKLGMYIVNSDTTEIQKEANILFFVPNLLKYISISQTWNAFQNPIDENPVVNFFPHSIKKLFCLLQNGKKNITKKITNIC